MTITFVSVIVAVFIGGIEALSLIGDQFKLQGGFWSATDVLTDDKYFGWIGFGIIALFALSWIVSIIIYRMNDYDSIEVRPGNSPLS
jgi:high-affinity nickel-transport protein